MTQPPLLCQGGDVAFPAGCPRRPRPADDLWVTLRRWCKEGNNALSQLIHTFGVVRSTSEQATHYRQPPARASLLRTLFTVKIHTAALFDRPIAIRPGYLPLFRFK